MPAVSGDVNCDGRVNAADVTALLLQFASDGTTRCGADVNGDGRVNGADLDALPGQLFLAPSTREIPNGRAN
jgi:hypothetical protein